MFPLTCLSLSVVSNEEAVAFIREHLDEPHFGAKSITLQSYARGSVDNISTIIIVFSNGIYQIGSSSTDGARWTKLWIYWLSLGVSLRFLDYVVMKILLIEETETLC